MFSSSTKSSISLPATLAIDASIAYSSNAASATRISRIADAAVIRASISPARSVDEALDRVGADDHFADLVFDRAKRPDRAARTASARPRSAPLPRSRSCAPPSHTAELEAGKVQTLNAILWPLPTSPSRFSAGTLHVLQDHRRRRRSVEAHLVLFVAAGDTPDARSTMNAVKSRVAVDLGEDDEEIGEAAVRDPHLLAVQHEAAVALTGGARFDAERVRTRPGFAEAVSADQDRRATSGWQIPALSVDSVPKSDSEKNRQVGLRAERGAKRRRLQSVRRRSST